MGLIKFGILQKDSRYGFNIAGFWIINGCALHDRINNK